MGIILITFVIIQAVLAIPILVYRYVIKKRYIEKNKALKISFGYVIILSLLVTIANGTIDLLTIIVYAAIAGVYYLILRSGAPKGEISEEDE